MKKIYKKKKLRSYFERETFLSYYAILLYNYKIFPLLLDIFCKKNICYEYYHFYYKYFIISIYM